MFLASSFLNLGRREREEHRGQLSIAVVAFCFLPNFRKDGANKGSSNFEETLNLMGHNGNTSNGEGF